MSNVRPSDTSDNVAAKIEAFFSRYRLRRYPKGQVLILEGENPGLVYYLVGGMVKVYDITYRGDEIILNIFKPPAFFPMSLAINKSKNSYVYEAETDVEIRQAPAGETVEFLRANPDVMLDLLGRVYRGTDGLMGRMSLLMSGSAKSRLMYELLVEARRFGEPINDDDSGGNGTQGGGRRIELNEKDLGARAGLSRETVSREIHKLREEGFLDIKGKYIVIGDISALEELLDRGV